MATLGVETNKVICVVIFGEVVFTHVSKLLNFLLVQAFIVHALARMDGDLDFDIVHNQIQPYMFEPLGSGHDSSDDNSRESDSVTEDGDYDVNQERIGQVDW